VGLLAYSRVELAREATAPTALHANAQRFFGAVTADALRLPVDQSYPLRKAKEAHADREMHSCPGSTVLLP
jgi:NADPH:quinone reductase-like Zn-dependent oxidoreductase